MRLKDASNGGRMKAMCTGVGVLPSRRPPQLAALWVSLLLRLKHFFLQGPCAFVHMKCLDPVCFVKEESRTSLEKENRCL